MSERDGKLSLSFPSVGTRLSFMSLRHFCMILHFQLGLCNLKLLVNRIHYTGWIPDLRVNVLDFVHSMWKHNSKIKITSEVSHIVS